MAWVVVVLDDLFGLPVTSGGVVVLESRLFAHGDALPYQTLILPDRMLLSVHL